MSYTTYGRGGGTECDIEEGECVKRYYEGTHCGRIYVK